VTKIFFYKEGEKGFNKLF